MGVVAPEESGTTHSGRSGQLPELRCACSGLHLTYNRSNIKETTYARIGFEDYWRAERAA
jgi:hypothetical protein